MDGKMNLTMFDIISGATKKIDDDIEKIISEPNSINAESRKSKKN